MDAKKEVENQNQAPLKGRAAYKQDKPLEQVKKECQAFMARINHHVRKNYGHDAAPVFIDKG